GRLEEPMRGSFCFIIIISILPASVSWAQESAAISPKSSEAVRFEPTSLVIQQSPNATSTKLEEEHARLFWILPTFSVADSKSVRPLTASGKFRLFVKDKPDPFTIGWVAFDAGLAQANNDFPEYG